MTKAMPDLPHCLVAKPLPATGNDFCTITLKSAVASLPTTRSRQQATLEVRPGNTTPFHTIPTWNEYPTYRLTENASPTRCPRCHSALWTLLSDRILAFTIRLDPTPLTIPQEIHHHIHRNPTWQTVKMGTTFTIRPRDVATINSPGIHIVLAEHLCPPETIALDLPNYWPTIHTDSEKAPF